MYNLEITRTRQIISTYKNFTLTDMKKIGHMRKERDKPTFNLLLDILNKGRG
jgi:hypothetical protein